jgi:hypothetical protein
VRHQLDTPGLSWSRVTPMLLLLLLLLLLLARLPLLTVPSVLWAG